LAAQSPGILFCQYINTDIVFWLKPVIWKGSSKRDLVGCSTDVMQAAGRELERVQRGADPGDWKPMAIIGRGAREIRVHVDGELRVFYVATFPEAVYVLHVFEKKTRKTAPRDLALGQERYRAMLKERRTP
jgi:phage-related protein